MKPSDISIGDGQRLHPMTIVQRGILSIPAMFFLLLPFFRNPDTTAWFNLVVAIAFAVFLFPWLIARYIRFRYWILPTEIQIHSGVFTRRRRNIPIDRIQNIEIEQALMPRLFGIAQVSIYTAGSQSAEGVLEYISKADAVKFKQVVRELQLELEDGRAAPSVVMGPSPIDVDLTSELSSNAPVIPSTTTLVALDGKRLFLSGAFRFSLLYIAFIYSGIQFIEPDPTRIANWLMQGPLRPVADTITAHPISVGLMVVILVSFAGWLTGVLVTANRYYGFQLTLEGNKLHRKHGFLTVREGTIPLRRIQSYILRSNPVMEFFGWYRLELQTMGIDLKQSGFQVATPMARLSEVSALIDVIGGLSLPVNWQPVSPKTIRRSFIRIAFVVLSATAGLLLVWQGAWWLLLVLAPGLAWSIERYRKTGYAINPEFFAVKRGIIRRMTWLIPVPKIQAIERKSTFFQRRLGLETLYIDTAGASAMQSSDLVDVPLATSRILADTSYADFSASWRSRSEQRPK